MGGVDIQVKMTGAKKRSQDKQGRHQQSARVQNLQGRIDAAKQENLTAGVNPNHEQQTDTQQHELDAPAHRADRRPKRALQVHHHPHRADQQKQVQSEAGPSEEQHPVASQRLLHRRYQFIAKPDRQPDGDEERACEEIPRFDEKTPGVSPGVAQAEEQPGPGKHRHREEPPHLPIMDLDLFGEAGRGTQAGKNVLGRQHRHASDKRPAGDRSARPQGGGERQRSATHRASVGNDGGKVHGETIVISLLRRRRQIAKSRWSVPNTGYAVTGLIPSAVAAAVWRVS